MDPLTILIWLGIIVAILVIVYLVRRA